MCKLFLICFSSLLLIVPISSQQRIYADCATHTSEDDINRLLRNKRLYKSNFKRNSEIIRVPIQFHLIANSDGNGRISVDQVFEGLCKLNEDFEDSGLQFYFNGSFNYIDNSSMYEMNYPPIPSAVNVQFSLQRVDGSVNIFVGNGLASGNSGFYTGNTDVIYMDKRYVNSQDNILAHEIGHFLSLPHTFLGWEETDYNPDEPTPTQVFRGTRTYNVEYFDREKNCEDSGDFFCDTPADYIKDWNGGCNYTGGAVDPDSVLIDPDERNIMSYFSFSGCEKFIFSEGQRDAMLTDFSFRSEFDGTDKALQSQVTNSPIITSPEIDSEVPFNTVLCSWEAPENSTLYKVELSRIPNFIALDQQIVTNSNSFTFKDLQEDKKYYWRVFAFNETNTCERVSSDTGVFTTSNMASETNDLQESTNVFIVQNPLTTNTPLTIEASEDLGELQLSIFDFTGKLLIRKQTTIEKGGNIVLYNSALSNGVYVVSLRNLHQHTVIKLLIQ